MTLDELRDHLKSERFTGVTILHWKNGEPRVVEVPKPDKIVLSVPDRLTDPTRRTHS